MANENQESKKIKLYQVGDVEPSCPKCKMSNAMLPQVRLDYPPSNDARFLPEKNTATYLCCRDCGYSVKEEDVEIEIVTREFALRNLS